MITVENVFLQIPPRLGAALRAAAALGFAATLGAAPAAAQEEAPALEKIKAWSVHAPKNAPIKMCFASTAPTDTDASRANIKRGKANLIVSNFPDQGVSEQVSVSLGFPADAKKPVEIKIDGRSFKMVADGEFAWLNSASEDSDAVAAMRRGARAEVTATSTRGTTVTDNYSLLGFTASVKRAGELCR